MAHFEEQGDAFDAANAVTTATGEGDFIVPVGQGRRRDDGYSQTRVPELNVMSARAKCHGASRRVPIVGADGPLSLAVEFMATDGVMQRECK